MIMHKINKILAALAILAAFVGLAQYSASTVLADPLSQSTSAGEACQGASLGGSNVCSTNSGLGLGHLLKDIIDVISLVLGAVAVLMMIIGGFKFITSGGDSNKVASARNTIIYALVGLVVAALAQVLVHFVLSTAQNASTAAGGGSSPSATTSTATTSTPTQTTTPVQVR
jgi:hypothetical protein